MSEFDDICKQFEKLDPATFDTLLREKSKKALDALAAITENGEDGATIFLEFILVSISADGKLAKEEFELVRPGLESFTGREISFDDAKKIFNRMNLNTNTNKEVVDLVVDLVGKASPELKTDMVVICMLICAADGKISGKEKAWIRQLIAE